MAIPPLRSSRSRRCRSQGKQRGSPPNGDDLADDDGCILRIMTKIDFESPLVLLRSSSRYLTRSGS
jgi:hypothetical protein